MGGEPAVSGEVPVAVAVELYGQNHLHEVRPRRQIYVRLIEQAVPETRSDEYSYEAVEEERLEEFVLYLLLFIEFSYYEIGEKKPHQPAQRIPVH